MQRPGVTHKMIHMNKKRAFTIKVFESSRTEWELETSIIQIKRFPQYSLQPIRHDWCVFWISIRVV